MSIHLGLKIWSTNKNYLQPMLKLYDKGIFNYVEIYAVPGSYEEFHSTWKNLPFSAGIHAPHFKDGINLADKNLRDKNKKSSEESFRFADALNAPYIVFHPGVEGETEETAFQLKGLNDKRIYIENKPYLSVDGKLICNGYSPEEIAFLKKETGYGFCLDIGHAICAANGLKREAFDFLKQMQALSPNLYHLTDGNFTSTSDRHDHYGKGNYPLAELVHMIPSGAMMTNESVKDSFENLDDFEQDALFIKNLRSSN